VPIILDPQLLTVAQVAELCACSQDTIRRRIREGDLPAVRLGAGGRKHLRVDPADLELWLFGEPEDAA
jgi:excisionase family DNA binding protein